MKTSGQKRKAQKVQVEGKRSKYAGELLKSGKEKAAKKFEESAMSILKQFGMVK